MKLVFATHNKNKLVELQSLLKGKVELLSLWDIQCEEEIEETETTLEGNALLKARYIYNRYGYDCIADDTGLEVEALNGAPGVFSARYAGLHCNSEDNINKLLADLQEVENRKAQFRTIIALIKDGTEYLFEGKVEGEILLARQGEKGFGYDAIFKSAGSTHSFAEISIAEKGKISHRGKAVAKLINYLCEHY